MKAIAYQQYKLGSEDGWETIATVRLQPDGNIVLDGPQDLIEDREAEFGFPTSILAPFWNRDLKPIVDKGDGEMGRFVSMAEGELFLETLVRFYGNAYYRFIPWCEDRGVEITLTDEEKARTLASGLSGSCGKVDTKPPGLAAQGNTSGPQDGDDTVEDEDVMPDCEIEWLPNGASIDHSGILGLGAMNQKPSASLEKPLEFIAEAPGHPATTAIAYQIADETPGLGGWRTVSEWRINPDGGLDQTGPEGLVHHDFGMDVIGCEMVLEVMLKNKSDANHRWVKVAGEEKPNLNSQPPAK